MTTATLTTDEILQRLREFKRAHQAAYRLTALGIFGSVARGEAEAGSDVDIVFQTTAPNLFRTSRLRQELEDHLGRRVDIVRLRDQMNPRLKRRILRDARYV